MRTRTRAILAGLALAATLVGGVAWATIPGASGTIQGCYTTGNGNLRVVESADECRNSETAISWNQQGQTGAAGANGANGADGAPGAKGDPCLSSDPACRGAKGDPGTNGADGRDGTDGLDGRDGVDGTDGVDGAPGTNGTNGVDGAPGPQGPAGPQGPPGSGSGGLASLDTLGGIACNAAGAAGTVVVTYGPPPTGAITLACAPATTPTLTVARAGAGTGSVSSDIGGIACGSTCSKSYTVGTVVTLTAAASANDVFTGWSGACTGTGTCTVTMNAAASVTATFAVGVELTIAQSGGRLWQSCPGFGACTVFGTDATISSAPAGLSCRYRAFSPTGFGGPIEGYQVGTCARRFPTGTSVTLTAADTDRATTLTWGGACAGASGVTCTIQLTADTAVTAVYPSS